MKLLMLGSGSYKSSLSIRLIAFSRHLSTYKWDSTVILPSADKYNNFEAEDNAQLKFAKLIQPWQPKSKKAILNLIPYLFTSFVSILRSDADAIYLYKPTPINILGLIPKLLSRTPVILDLDDLGSEVMKSENQSKLQYKLVEYCERLAIRFSSSVVVASTFLEEVVKEKFPNKQVTVIPNGVEPQEHKAAKLQQPRNAIYYFGAVNRLSLIEDLLRSLPKVIAEIPSTEVTIVGGGSALGQAEKLARQLKISDHIKFTGWVDMLDIGKYVKFADVAICYQPDTRTVRAASNMKVFQYMALASVPVVSDVGDLALYLKNGQAGEVVAPNKPEALSVSLIELLNDSERRRKMALRSRELAEKEYSWDLRTKYLADVLRISTKDKSDESNVSLPKLKSVDDKNLPFLSVVVCSYNGAKIIGRTIESIQAQNYPKDRFEIIVVDDGSSDNTAEVSQSYKGVRLVKQPFNQGISAGRNAGLRAAKGDIYVCSDDDCIYREDWLRQIASGYTLKNTVGVGGYLAEMEELRGVLNYYFSAIGSGFPPIVEVSDSRPNPFMRLYNYLKTSLGRLDDRQDEYVRVSELYGANGSFPITVLKAVGGWREGMAHIEDRDISKRILDFFPGQSFYAVRKAEVIHDPGIPLKKFLLRQYHRASDTFSFCRTNGIMPPIFPFPIVFALAFLASAFISLALIPIVAILLPQLLYFWWLYNTIKYRKIVYLAFPYIQLAEETMETAGIIKAYWVSRGKEKHAFI